MLTALIIGHSGQDGTYLAQLLREKGYVVTGMDRRRFDVTRRAHMHQLLSETKPHEIYYLAAFHHSSEEPRIDAHELIERSIAVNTLGLNNVLDAVVAESPASRLFYAASSRVFGDPSSDLQNEDTPLQPACAYGISKTAGIQICRYYRATHQVFAAAGILYNHESPLRSARFISRKIVGAAVRIARGSNERLTVGNLNAMVDWGYAPDYTRAMWQILQLEQPSDFVIGTGTLHSVRDFAQTAFAAVGLDWQAHVVENASFLQRTLPKGILCADSAKLRSLSGWRPEVAFEQMVRLMIDAEKR